MRAPPRRSARVDPLEQEIEDALRPGHFMKYGAGWSFVEGLDRVEKKLAMLVGSAPAREVRAEHYRKTGFMSGFEAVVAGAGSSAKPTFLERAKVRWPRSSES